MAIKGKNIHDDYILVGVFATSTAYLADFRNGGDAEEGDMYYDTTLDYLRSYDGSSWSPAGLSSTSAGSLDDAAQVGAKITNTQAIEIEATSPSTNLLILDSNGTGTADVIDISQAGGATHLINLTQAGTGMDIDGTSSTWSVDKAGEAIFANVWLKDSKPIEFGTASGGDMTLQFVDGSTPGTAGAGLMLAAVGGADQLQLGSSNAIDILTIGSSTANFMHWDASADALKFDNADVIMGDNDQIILGDGSDVLMDWDATNFQITPAANNADMIIGTSAAAFSLKVFGDTDTSYIEWKSDYDRLNFQSAAAANDVMLQFDDYAQITFGTGSAGFGTTGSGDVQMVFDGTDFLIGASAADTPLKFGDTSAGFDITYYWETAGTIVFDYDGDVVTFDGGDLKLGDDDYLLLGDSAVAGSDVDGTVRWDSTNTEVEIIGNTRFEDDVEIDGGLTLTGTLTMSGSLAPGSVALGDAENLTFGDGSDFTISTAGSTAGLIITAATANDEVVIGDGSVATDFRINNITTAGADIWFDQSADSANGILYLGTSGTGIDLRLYSDTAGDYCLWDMNADTNGCMIFEDSGLCMNDDTTLRFGDGAAAGAGDFTISSDGSDLFVKEIASAGKGVEFGVNNKGLDVKFYGETASAYMEWDQSADALVFDNADINMGDGDIIKLGDGTDLSISATGTTITATMAAGSAMTFADTNNASSKITFGTSTANGLDIVFQTGTTGDNITFDAASKTWTTTDVSTVFTDGTVAYTFSHATNALTLAGTSHANCQLTLGTSTTEGLDVVFQTTTAGDNITFDAGGSTWTTTDVSTVYTDGTIAYTLAHATNALTLSGTSHANCQLTLGTTTSEGLDVVFQSVNTGTNVTFDAGSELWTFGATAGNGIDVTFQSVNTSSIVKFDAGAESWTFGASAGNSIDVIFQGAATGATITWDGGAGTLTSSSAANTVYTLTANEDGICVPSKAGTPSSTGATANSLVYDSTNKKLYVFDSGTTTWLGTIALT